MNNVLIRLRVPVFELLDFTTDPVVVAEDAKDRVPKSAGKGGRKTGRRRPDAAGD